MIGSTPASVLHAVAQYSADTFCQEVLARMGEYGTELWEYEPRSSEPVLSEVSRGKEPFTYVACINLSDNVGYEVFSPLKGDLAAALETLLKNALPWVANTGATGMIIRQMPRIECKYDPMREHYLLVPIARWVPITIRPGQSLSNHGLRKIETPKSDRSRMTTIAFDGSPSAALSSHHT